MKEQQIASLAARITLAAGFLSAVADRFGVWGAPGAANVSWGDWRHFVAAVATLNGYAPKALLPALAVMATAAESSLGVLLLVGYQLRWTAYAAAGLLTVFGTAMIFSLGVKAPLDYSVFAAAGAAFLLAAQTSAATKKRAAKLRLNSERQGTPVPSRELQ
ncbi:MAG: DoxX family protein [Acidobacteriaceae bacterium]|nr:DoxX family protein [Acidobacteriaceae bacterium]